MTVLMPSWYYEKKDLKKSPSIVDGIDADRESRYRREGARFIINVGTKMGLRYDTMATGVIYFHRFYMFHSFRTFPRYVTACCCLFLAGKVEETPKKCKDIIRTARSFLSESQFAQFGDDPKEEVMTLERILLQTIKFDLQVDHPYVHLLKYAKCLKGDKGKLQKMVQMAWTFINDSLCTTLCLQWEPEVIAIALMHLAGKLSKFEVIDWVGRTPRHASWWDMYIEGMSVELLEDICHQVLDLYSAPIPDTPQDSPPATPPTKSTRKVQPASPVAVNSSPVQTKTKEVPVGQPIPRLEPGELKRKAAKSATRKDPAESKVVRSSTATSRSKKGSTSSSPVKPILEPERKSNSPDTPTSSENSTGVSHFIQTVEPSYRTGIAQFPQPAKAPFTSGAEASKQAFPNQPTTAPVYSTNSQSSSGQYVPYGPPPPQYYIGPETEGQYYPDGQQQPLQQASFVPPPHFPTPQLPPTHVAPPPQPTSQPPPQSHPPPHQPYPPQPLPSQCPPPHQPQYPPPIPGSAVVGQYQPPPLQPPGSMMIPNASMPPPTANLSQPPPMPMGMANMRSDMPPRMPRSPNYPPQGAPPSMPPGMMPPPRRLLHDGSSAPQMTAPPHYVHRPEPDAFVRDSRSGMDHGPVHRPNVRPENRLGHGPAPFLREDHSQDYNPRGHYEHDRPPHFRNKRSLDYDREHYDNSSYMEDEYNHKRRHTNPYDQEYDNQMPGPPPPRHYSLEHQAHRKHERGPPPSMMKHPPQPEVPTGIPPVRITGSPFPPNDGFPIPD